MSEPIKRAELCPGNGYKYTVLAVPFADTLDAGVLGSSANGTLIVECFTGRAYLFSPNSVSDFVDVHYVCEKFGLKGEHAHAVAAVIAELLGRKTNSNFAVAEVLP